MSNKTKYLCLAGVLIIAGFFRFYHLTTTPPGLYVDEAMDGVNAQNVAQTGHFKVYYPEDNGREGLYVNILAVAFKYHLLPETAPWSVRFPAAVAGFLTVLGMYLLVSELFKESYELRDKSYEGEKAGKADNHTSYLIAHSSSLALLAAFLLATSFWHINFSRIGFRAILAPFCLVWASYLLIKLFRARTSLGSWLLALGAGVIYAAGFYTYIAFRITPLLLLLFVPFFRKNHGFWKRAFLFCVVAFIVACPIGWYYLHNRADFFGRTSQISVSNSKTPIADLTTNILKTAAMFNWRGDGNWRQNIAGAPELWWPVGLLFLVGIFLNVWWLLSKKRPKTQITKPKEILDTESQNHGHGYWGLDFGFWFLSVWFFLGALPEVLSDEGIPHALRSLLMVVPIMVFAAIGAVILYRLVAARLGARWTTVLTALFVAVIVAGAYVQYFVTWAENPNVPGAFSADYVQIGNEINALPPSMQKYVIIDAGGVIDYGLPMPAEPVLYVTNSFVPDATAQKVVKNIHYILPDETGQIPIGTPSDTIFTIR